jgi:tetratricopeptide (TPR) repeat protein
VTDFGLARFQRDVSLTRTGDLVGTLRYMSPEQAAGQAAPIDHRTDIYSLGATLYELACLRPAFGDRDGPALLQQIAACEPLPPRQLRPQMPVDLETVILKAMSKEREGRYASAQQLADDLRCVAEGRPTNARPPLLAERIWRWARRRQRSLAAAACLLLVAVAGTYACAVLIARERTHAATKVVRLDESKAKTAAENFALQRQVALSYDQLAATHSQLRETDAARRCYRQAIDLQAQLLHESPANCDVQHDLAVSWNNLGLLLSRTGRPDEAEAALRRSLELQAALVTQQPAAANFASDLGGTWCNLGIVLEKRGRLDLANEAYAQALRHQQAAAALSPESPRFRELLSQHQGHRTRVVRALESAAASPTNLVTPSGREL